MALGHRWPWDQVGGARVGRGTVALRCLGCLPTITSSISGVKDAQRSRRQSIWAVYTSLRHTAKYTGFGCISYVYSLLASSRLACQDIQRIQHIQHIQPYSHTRHTSYSAIQPPSECTEAGVRPRPAVSGRPSASWPEIGAPSPAGRPIGACFQHSARGLSATLQQRPEGGKPATRTNERSLPASYMTWLKRGRDVLSSRR